jgi:hypothetical protein
MPAKFDGLIEAVRYDANGRLILVRAYERRGSAYSDNLLIDRETLMASLKSRKRFVTGKRVHNMGGTFQVGNSVRVSGSAGQEFVVSGSQAGSRDFLEGVPIF